MNALSHASPRPAPAGGPTRTVEVVPVPVPSLGNRCHLVHDGRVALVVDPPRDLGPVEHAAETAEVDVVAVAETHLHNDYVSGGLGLARRHGADHLLAAGENVDFERVGVRGGDELAFGGLRVRVVDTPGHTRHHQAFVVTPTDDPGAAPALLSGGSLLHGAVGRTDLVDRRLARALAEHQWTSVRHLARSLPPRAQVHPTHGFGSFCAASAAAAGPDVVTLAVEQQRNPALGQDRPEFVERLLAGLGPVPGHYAFMAGLNRRGAGAAPGRPPRRLTSDEVRLAMATGAWVVDLRDRASFAEAHLPGSVGIEHSAQAATYLGWVVPWGAEVVLLSADGAEGAAVLAEAVRDLAGIGIEGVGTHQLVPATPSALPLTARYRRTDWAGFEAAGRRPGARPVVVDVRQRDEWEAGHLPGALHLPVQDVPRLAATLPTGELWVHCRSGYRAGLAASLLHRLGREVVHVDDAWDALERLRVPTTVVPQPA